MLERTFCLILIGQPFSLNPSHRALLVVGKLVRFSVLGVVLVVAFGLGVGGLARVTPTSFLPEED